jgi:hypothetical protein
MCPGPNELSFDIAKLIRQSGLKNLLRLFLKFNIRQDSIMNIYQLAFQFSFMLIYTVFCRIHVTLAKQQFEFCQGQYFN